MVLPVDILIGSSMTSTGPLSCQITTPLNLSTSFSADTKVISDRYFIQLNYRTVLVLLEGFEPSLDDYKSSVLTSELQQQIYFVYLLYIIVHFYGNYNFIYFLLFIQNLPFHRGYLYFLLSYFLLIVYHTFMEITT